MKDSVLRKTPNGRQRAAKSADGTACRWPESEAESMAFFIAEGPERIEKRAYFGGIELRKVRKKRAEQERVKKIVELLIYLI